MRTCIAAVFTYIEEVLTTQRPKLARIAITRPRQIREPLHQVRDSYHLLHDLLSGQLLEVRHLHCLQLVSLDAALDAPHDLLDEM